MSVSKTEPQVSNDLLPDPANPGWVKGWGVFSLAPWHLYAVRASELDAAASQLEAGAGYVTAYGSHRKASDDFITGNSDSRWIASKFSPDQLTDKKVFARFATQDGGQFEGTGQLRVRQRRSIDSLIAVDLVFTRRDSETQFTDIVFFLNAAQLAKLRPASQKAKYDFEYTGILRASEAFTLEAGLQHRLNRIDELKREIDSLRPFNETTEAIVEQKLRVDWNYNSNAIEGNQVSRGETELFLEQGLTAKGKPFKDYLDIRGHDEAIGFLKDLVSRKEPLTEAVIRELHKILLVEPYETPAEALDGTPTTKIVRLGEYKSLPNHVKTVTGAIHYYARPEETPALMEGLINWYRGQNDASELHPVVISSLFHHRFTAIHPFDDGNGRMARLLMNLILMQHQLPPAVLRFEKRNEYLSALQQADSGTHSTLIGEIADEVIRSLATILRGAKGEDIEEPDDIDKEIRLLKQQLQHIEDPVELDEVVQNGVFAKSIQPLFRRLGGKLAAFDDFYSTHSVRIQGQSKQGTGEIGWARPALASSKEIGSELQLIKLDYAIITQLQMIFEWRDLKKSPLSTVNDAMQIAINFQKLNFIIIAQTIPYTIKHVYNSPLKEQEITSFVSAVCRKLMSTIQSEIKTNVTEQN